MKDTYMGSTIIDLEDRFFSHKWSSLIDKPVETRFFLNDESDVEMGEMKMFLEILNADEAKIAKLKYS